MKKILLILAVIAMVANGSQASASVLPEASPVLCQEVELSTVRELTRDGEIGLHMDDGGSRGVILEDDPCDWTMQGHSVVSVDDNGGWIMLTCRCEATIFGLLCKWSR